MQEVCLKKEVRVSEFGRWGESPNYFKERDLLLFIWRSKGMTYVQIRFGSMTQLERKVCLGATGQVYLTL